MCGLKWVSSRQESVLLVTTSLSNEVQINSWLLFFFAVTLFSSNMSKLECHDWKGFDPYFAGVSIKEQPLTYFWKGLTKELLWIHSPSFCLIMAGIFLMNFLICCVCASLSLRLYLSMNWKYLSFNFLVFFPDLIPSGQLYLSCQCQYLLSCRVWFQLQSQLQECVSPTPIPVTPHPMLHFPHPSSPK